MKLTTGLLLLLATATTLCWSTEIVYTPTNPTFGGSPLNGSFLLNKAQSQNNHASDSKRSNNDPLSRFQESLQRNILSQIAKQVSDLAFGESGIKLGEELEAFNTDQYTIDIDTMNTDFISITITDRDNPNNITTIQVPIYN